MLLALPTALQTLLTAVLWPTTPETRTPAHLAPSLTFHLRHHHALSAGHSGPGRVIFADASLPPPPSGQSFLSTSLPLGGPYTVPITPQRVPRPPSLAAFTAARRKGQSLKWGEEEVPGPDVSTRESLLQLARMAHDTYFPVGDKYWYDVGEGWNETDPHPIGWLRTQDGLRGHIFVSTDNSTVAIALKGTSAGWLAGAGGPTTKNDIRNDNLLFSCCCARVGPTWSPVCGCYRRGGRCGGECVEEAVGGEGAYYDVGMNLYNNVSYMYPEANIWLVGHSLGGGLASLLGATFGAPAVAFESPGEKMAAKRLHLPSPPSTHHITHVFHTADPVPMGTCTGVTSLCALDGLALESRCHLGQIILYDTISSLHWSASVRTHPIDVVISRLLADDSEWAEKGGLGVPEARAADEVEGDAEGGECFDCYKWNFEYGNVSASVGIKGGQESC